MLDDVNLKENCAKDFARRCENIALERKTIADTQDAMSNPNFKKDFHLLMDKLASETRAAMPLTKRPACFTVMLGRYKTRQKMIKSVTVKGHKISDYGLSVINNKQFLMLQKPEEYEFFWTTGRFRPSAPLPQEADCNLNAMGQSEMIDPFFYSASSFVTSSSPVSALIYFE